MEPVFKNVKFNGNFAKFQLSPTHVAYANTLRRLCISYVETVGFRADIGSDGSTTDVKILSNSTPMTNEMLAHRIGLLPIYADPKTWDSEKYTFVLHKINDSEKVMDVFASDFKVLEKRGDETVEVSSRDFFRPSLGSGANDTCLIATLKPLLPGGKPEENSHRSQSNNWYWSSTCKIYSNFSMCLLLHFRYKSRTYQRNF